MRDIAVTIRLCNIVYQSTREQREAARETALSAIRNRREQQRNNLRSAGINATVVDLNRAAFLYDCTILITARTL